MLNIWPASLEPQMRCSVLCKAGALLCAEVWGEKGGSFLLIQRLAML